MANDSSVPSVSRDMAKKKRANRSAKLKQCKLDARREQWLSQVVASDILHMFGSIMFYDKVEDKA